MREAALAARPGSPTDRRCHDIPILNRTSNGAGATIAGISINIILMVEDIRIEGASALRDDLAGTA
ncbi:MAG: hypothetical protein ACI8RZ_003365 [Myxococcota bacterium]